MAPAEHVGSRGSLRIPAALLSVGLHVALLLAIAFSSGRHDGIDHGDTPASQLVLLDAPRAMHQEGDPSTPTPLTIETLSSVQQPAIDPIPPPAVPEEESPAPPESVLPEPVMALAAPAQNVPAVATPAESVDQQATIAMPAVERAAVEHQLERFAEQLADHTHTRVTWEASGKRYSAMLTLQPAGNGVDLDRVIAEVSAEDHGRQLTTLVRLKRLAFSNYTQMIDRWDPLVQLHADEVIGRFHVNSRFNLLYDGRTSPQFLGKVTTAAGSFDAPAATRRRANEIFRGGIETGTGRIELPEQVQPSAWAPAGDEARIHRFDSDTRIRFFADGTYSWRNEVTDTARYDHYGDGEPEYFVAGPRVSLSVEGVVRGRVLVYSPQRIVVTGNLIYARDPRHQPDSGDYLGLVSSRNVEIASASTTGPGDLMIQAAVFAGRRFIIWDADSPRTATLRIYGSLAAGTVSASEPRFATRIEYDARLEQTRPPGFPNTNRFATESDEAGWIEASTPTASTIP